MLQYLQKIHNIIDAIEKTRKITSSKPNQTLSAFISPDFDLIKLELEDTEDLITHWLLLKPDDNSLAKKFNILEYSMPPGLIFNPANSLPDHAEEMMKHVNRLSYFTNGLTFIDMYACVVEPVLKSSRDTYRVLKYRDKIYIRVSFHPSAINQDDLVIEFIGPRELTSGMQEKYRDNKDNWDSEAGLYFNLKKVLDVQDFPEQIEGMVSEKDCDICMHYRDKNDLAPLFTCNNMSCNIQFHHSCIIKWWAMQKTSNLFHGVVKGQCPNCKTFFELNKRY